GGVWRGAAVGHGLAALGAFSPAPDVLLVHDAARPFASPALFARVAGAALEAGAALAATPLTDTLKRARDGRVIATVPRDHLWRAQTPQGFRFELFRRAHDEAARSRARGESPATDDVALVERLGIEAVVVDSPATNLKITNADD